MVEVYQIRPRPQTAQELAKKDKQLEITKLIRPKIASNSPEVIKADRTKEVPEIVRPNAVQEVSTPKEINKLPEVSQAAKQSDVGEDYLDKLLAEAKTNRQISNPVIGREIKRNLNNYSEKIASCPINEIAKDLKNDRRHQKMVEGSNWGDVDSGVIASDEYWGFLASYE